MHSTESITSLEDDDDDDVRPASSRMPSAWFSGYHPIPPVINLYGNFSGVIDAVTTLNLCGADKNDFLYVVEIHHGLKMKSRQQFEWRKLTGKDKANTQPNRFILVWPPPSSISASSSSSAHEESEILADLTFCNVMSVNHFFVLELKGAAASGEMGDRWTLMVVVTALRLYWLRCYGKTNKAVVGLGQKLRGK